MSHPLAVHADWMRKFGVNVDVDTTTDPEDVWANGGVYTFPSSAAACTLVSDDDNDDDGDTGARTVRVYGLDANYMKQQEDVTLNGTSTVALANTYLRVFRMEVLTAGSTGTNEGTLSLVHGGATTLAAIQATPTVGSTMMAIYTIPKDYSRAYLARFRCGMIDAANNAEAMVRLDVRPENGAWRTIDIVGLRANGSSAALVDYPGLGISIAPGSDMRVRVQEVSNDNTSVFALFNIAQEL